MKIISLYISSFLLGIGLCFSDVVFFRQPANTRAMVGEESVNMQCIVENFRIEDEFSIQWKKNGILFNTFDSRRTLSESDLIPGKKNLIIRNIELADDASYSCQFFGLNQHGQKRKLISVTARLNVIAPPEDVQMNSIEADGKVMVRKGGRTLVTCTASNSKPASTISWRVAGVVREATDYETKTDSMLTTATSSLEIDSYSTRSGNGIECIFSHPAYQEPKVIKAKLEIIYPPGSPEISGDEGQDYYAGQILRLTCQSLGGNPLANLTWTIGDRVISSTLTRESNRSRSKLTYRIQSIDHKKKLTCSASSRALDHPLSVNIDLNVLFHPRNLTLTQDPDMLRENERASLKCVALRSNPRARLEWYVNNTIIEVNHPRFQISTPPSTEELIQSFLHIESVKREDKFLIFSCKASIPSMNYTDKVSINLDILYPPTSLRIAVLDSSYSGSKPVVVEGHKIQIQCKVESGNPAPSLVWYRDDQQISNTNHMKISTLNCEADYVCSVLEVLATSVDNGVDYACQARHDELHSPLKDFINLQVYFPPSSVAIRQDPPHVVSGNPVELHCLTKPSNPESTIDWYRGSELLDLNKNYSFSPSAETGFVSRSIIKITAAPGDDKTNITCRARNIVNKNIDVSFAMKISYPPYFEANIKEFTATKGERNYNIYLPAHASPNNITYQWSRLLPNGQNCNPHVSPAQIGADEDDLQTCKLHQSDRVAWSHMEGNLNIVEVIRSDEGFYVLEAENILGKADIKFRLNVVYPPVIRRLEGPDVVDENENITLSCQVESHPSTQLQIHWEKKSPNPHRIINNVETSENHSILRLHSITSNDRGLYQCIAFNGVGGPISKDIRLQVKFSASIDHERTPRKVAKPPKYRKIAKLSCFASGKPQPIFQWQYKNGSAVKSPFPIKNLSLGGDTYKSQLTIKVDKNSPAIVPFVCKVFNHLGKESAEILLVPSGPPDPPLNLNAVNATSKSVFLSWRPGFDGGAKQNFTLQYRKFEDEKKYGSKSFWIDIFISSGDRSYNLSQLAPETVYYIRMVAVNKYGKSDVTSEVVVETESQLHLMGSRDSGDSAPSYLLAILCVCGFMACVLLISVLVFCRKKTKKSKNDCEMKNSQTTSSNLSPASPEKNLEKVNESDHTSNASIAPPETISGGSEFSACGLMSTSRRLEMSPSPDSTYSSLVPDNRSRIENNYVDQECFIGKRSSVADAVDPKENVSLLRRANSISGVRCQSSQSTMTYMDFLRRATTLENEDACRRRMEELDQNTTNQFGDTYQSNRLYHTLSSSLNRHHSMASPGQFSFVGDPLINNHENRPGKLNFQHQTSIGGYNCHGNSINVTNGLLKNPLSSATSEPEKRKLLLGEKHCHFDNYLRDSGENPYLAIMNQKRPSSLSVRPINDLPQSVGTSNNRFFNMRDQSSPQASSFTGNLSPSSRLNEFHSSSSTQPLLSSGRRCMTPVHESDGSLFSCSGNVNDPKQQSVAFLGVDQAGTLFI